MFDPGSYNRLHNPNPWRKRVAWGLLGAMAFGGYEFLVSDEWARRDAEERPAACVTYGGVDEKMPANLSDFVIQHYPTATHECQIQITNDIAGIYSNTKPGTDIVAPYTAMNQDGSLSSYQP